MSVFIPLVSQLSASEQVAWCTALNHALQHSEVNVKVCLPEMLDEQQHQEVTCAIVANPDPALLKRYPNLVWVHSLWAGVERLVKALKGQKIKLVRLIDPRLADTMAQACVAWSYYVLRDMHCYQQQQNQARWQQHPVRLTNECNITVLGLGELGRTAALALTNNNFNVVGWSKHQKNINGVDCLAGEPSLNKALCNADIVICLLPLTTATKGLLNQHRINNMKVGATLINFARSAIIDEQALLNALDNRHIAHAILDVFAQEPLPKEHSFWRHNNITVLPHISAPTSQQSASKMVASNIASYLSTGELPAHVDLVKGY
ncbi:2-hydroxyacid dehydrogenase [Thalassotalea sediminis]|uniref:2-hydroxyacid dehydrogenase n=1 Tax=Thalassotalea sediminis TaxID=1759089 RepID=UPI00257320CD|nr:glyoxylate/hydroxypyruvate reductase A [Thalassotalea sediminis]